MSPHLRKLVLTTHISSSVGWMGAVAAFLCLALTGLNSPDAGRVGAACIAMDILGWFVILPACLTSLATGIVQSLGTPWGLLRHQWTLAKLLITVVSTILLLVHMRPISYLGRIASQGGMGLADLRDTRVQLVTASVTALFALLVATVLSVYKPKGLTAYGRRTQPQPL
jgi:hypothetical protein